VKPPVPSGEISLPSPAAPAAIIAGASLVSQIQHFPVPLGVFPAAVVLGYGLYRGIRSLQVRRDSGTEFVPLPPLVLTPAPPGPSGRPAPPPPGPPVARVWRPTGEWFSKAPWDVGQPSVVPRRRTQFDRNLVLSFVLIVIAMMLIRHPIFYIFDQIIRFVGDGLYWPRHWPTVTPNVTPGLPVPDYILLMYVALIGSFLLAAGVPAGPRYTSAQRRTVAEILLVYLVLETLLDVVDFTVSDPFAFSAFLLLRGILGGIAFTGILLTVLVLPPAAKVTARFPRDRGAIVTFVGSWVASIAIAGVFLFVLYRDFAFGTTDLSFGVLLLLPLMTFVTWVFIGRLLYERELLIRPPKSLSEYHPKVSILIPAYNEELTIAAAVRSADLAARRYPGEVEIIVGNDGSTDRTATIARTAIGKLQNSAGAVLDLPHGGKSNALNGMLRLASGEIVVRMDADARMSPSVGFERIVGHLAVPEVGGVQGAILPLQEEGWTRRLRFMEVCWAHMFLRRATMATRTTQVVDGAFCAFRRADLLRVGGWVPWNGEDTEITLRLQRFGYRMRYETRALAYEDVPDNYERLERQRIRWFRGGLFAHHRHLSAAFSDTPEFGGLAIAFWLALFLRNGLRSLIYLYVVAVALFLPTLLHLVVILGILFLARGTVIAYYLIRIGRWRFVPWVITWPITSAIKQHISLKSWGSMLPGSLPEFSE
jgi:cellulose synthase/poly-beta-1,6-N-acetylglucosamine synthase-like glycosyltransferase